MGTGSGARIHVAGVIDLAEAQLLIDCGSRISGFPLVLGYHKEDLTIDAAATIVAELGNEATFFLITYANEAGDFLELCRVLSVDMVQLHGETSLEEIKLLKREAPKLRIIKSLIVRGQNTEYLDRRGSALWSARRLVHHRHVRSRDRCIRRDR